MDALGSNPQTAARRLRNVTTGEVVATHVGLPATRWERALGFLPRNTVDSAEGLWFDGTSAIHTIGMRARIDVVFLDAERIVVRVFHHARANRIFRGGSRAVATVELAPGVAQAHVRLGDRLALE